METTYIQQSQLGKYLGTRITNERAHRITKALEAAGVKVLRPTPRVVLIERASLDTYLNRIRSGEIKPPPKWWRGLQMSARKRGETWPAPDAPEQPLSA